MATRCAVRGCKEKELFSSKSDVCRKHYDQRKSRIKRFGNILERYSNRYELNWEVDEIERQAEFMVLELEQKENSTYDKVYGVD